MIYRLKRDLLDAKAGQEFYVKDRWEGVYISIEKLTGLKGSQYIKPYEHEDKFELIPTPEIERHDELKKQMQSLRHRIMENENYIHVLKQAVESPKFLEFIERVEWLDKDLLETIEETNRVIDKYYGEDE